MLPWLRNFSPRSTSCVALLRLAGVIAGAAGGLDAALWGVALGVPLMVYGWVNYRVQGFRLLTSHKTAGGIGFTAAYRAIGKACNVP